MRRGETQCRGLFKQIAVLPLRRKRNKALDRSSSGDYEVCNFLGARNRYVPTNGTYGHYNITTTTQNLKIILSIIIRCGPDPGHTMCPLWPHVENPIGPGSELGNKLGNFCTGSCIISFYTALMFSGPTTDFG